MITTSGSYGGRVTDQVTAYASPAPPEGIYRYPRAAVPLRAKC